MLPPQARSRAALGLTAAAARGVFALQVCTVCQAVQYPPREACHRCLATRLKWRRQDGTGELLAATTIHHSHEPYFRERLPWRIGMVKLDAGPTVIAHLPAMAGNAPTRVVVAARLDKGGQGVLVAMPEKERDMAEDRIMQEMSCDPRSRKVLVTDGTSALGQALARALLQAGADTVWLGRPEPAGDHAGLTQLADIKGIALVALDVTRADSVRDLALELGERIDIVINNAEYPGAQGIASASGVEAARAEMDVNYFGALRLAQELGPALRARVAEIRGACAWVNILSIFALSNFPAHGTFSASKAAALSLSQCLRAEMRPAGIRVLNLFPGPLDHEANQLLPQPKLAPAALAAAVVRALRDGTEDVYPGEVAEDWLARLQEDPKILERELG